jgi:hypothetical protein
MIMNDKNGKKIGQVTGWNGYWTNQLPHNHLTMVGYPGNLDSGQLMEINHASTYMFGGENTWKYGAAMHKGSSGGAWILHYGYGQQGNADAGKNRLVGVTSYGPIDPALRYIGASNLNSEFLTLLNNACGRPGTGNCE